MASHKSDINVGIKFNADTSQAQQQIQALQASLNKISMAGTGKGISAEMQKAAAAAQQLQMHLQKAYNSKTGNLDLSLLNRSLASTKSNISDLSAALYKSGVDGQAAFVNLAKSIANANQPMLKTNALLNQMLSTLGNTLRWEISSRILHGFERSIQQAYSYSKNLNKSLTDIRIVTGYSADKMADFAIEANKAAKALSTTTKEYTDASLIYFQQGLNDQQVKERTDITIKMANVTRESAQTVSDQMTAVWNNFDDGSKSLEYYSDVLTALGAATASSTAEITEGLEKFAAVAETVGLSYEYASAALTTITSNTRQSASEVGTALKTLLSRIQGLKLGETLDDGTDLNKYSKALDAVGISIKDQNGQLKAMDDLLDEMAAKWKTLNNDQQVALAQTVAGVRQYTQLIALMENWSGSDNDNMLANLRTAAGAEGSLQKQADIYAESWEAASKRAKAALEEIYSTILDDTFFIKLTDTFAELTTGIGDFIKGIGGMKGIILSTGSILLNLLSNKIAPAFNNLRYNIEVLFKSAGKAAIDLSNSMNNVTKGFLNSSFSGNLDAESRALLENTVALNNAKSKLAITSKNLSENERIQFEQQLENIKILQEQYLDTAKNIDKTKKSIDDLANSIDYEAAKVKVSKESRREELRLINELKQRKEELANLPEGTKSKDLNAAVKAVSQARTAYYSFQEKLESASAGSEYFTETLYKQYAALMKTHNGNLTNISDMISLKEGFYNQISDLDKLIIKSQKHKQVTQEDRSALSLLRSSIDDTTAKSLGLDKAFDEAFKVVNVETFVKRLVAIRNTMEQAKIPAKDLEKTLIGLGQGENIRALQKKYKELEEQQKRLKEQQDAVNKSVNEFNPKHFITGVEAFASGLSALSSFAMGLNSIKSAFEALKNEDLSGFEKFTSVTMSLSMGVGMLINSMSGLGKVYEKLTGKVLLENVALKANNILKKSRIYISEKEIVQITKERAARMVNNLLQEQQNGLITKENALQKISNVLKFIGVKDEERELIAKKLLNKELTIEEVLRNKINAHKLKENILDAVKNNAKSFLGILGKIAALLPIILLLAAAIGGAIAWYNNTPEKRLEKAKKLTEETKTAAEEAKTAYDNLKSTINDYETAVDNISELTRGTEEFTNAVEEANKKARELIDTYGIVEGINIDSSTGLITFDDGVLENAEKKAQIKASAVTGKYYGAQSQEKTIENENLIHQYTRKNIFGDLSEDAAEKKITEAFNNGNLNISLLDKFYSGEVDSKQLAKQLELEEYIVKQIFNKESKDQLYKLITSLNENTAAIENSDKVFLTEVLSNSEDYQNSDYKNAIIAYLDNQGYSISERTEEYANSGQWLDLDKVKEAFGADKVSKGIFQSDYNVVIGGEKKNVSQEEAAAAVAALEIAGESELAVEKLLELIDKNPQAGKFLEAYALGDTSMLENSLDLNKLNFYKNGPGITATPRDILAQVFGDANIMNNLEDYGLNEEDISKYITFINTAFEDAMKKTGLNEIEDPELKQKLLEFYSSLSEEDKTLFLELDLEDKSFEEIKAELDELTKERAIKIKVDNSFTEGMTSTIEAIKTADEVLGNYKENGKLNYSDVSSLMKDFSDVEDYQLYIDIMTAEGATAKDVEQALEGLVSKKIDLLATNEDLSEKDLELIDLALEEAGVVNHSEIAQYKYGKALINNIKNIEELTDEEKKLIQNVINYNSKKPFNIYKKSADFASIYNKKLNEVETTTNDFNEASKEASKTLYDEAEAFFKEVGANDLAKIAMIELIAQLTIFNNTDLSVEQKIQALADLADQAAITGMYIDGIFQGDKALAYGTAVEIGERHGFSEGEIQDLIRKYEGDYEKIVEEIMKKELLSKGEATDEEPEIDINGPEDKNKSSAEPLEYEDEIERYHENTRAIERLSRALDKVSTAKDRAFGKERLRLIDQEIAATEKLVAQQRALLHETREYLKQDFAEIQQYGFTYDEFGELTNYDEVMKAQIDRYNAAVATGNADAIEAAKKEYEEFKENMEQYEETLTQYEEAQAQLQEYINQVVDLKLEKITTEVEIKILVNDKELTRLEYLLRKIEYEGKGAADAIGLMGRQFEQISEKAKPIQEAIDKIYEQARAEGRGLLEEEVKEIKSFYQDGVISSEEEKRIKEIYDKAASEDRMLTQAEEEQIQEYKEQLLELNEEVMDIVETIEGKFIETLEELNGKVDESIGRFATYTGMFQTLSDVITLSGKAGSKYGMDMLNTLSARTVANASTAMRSNLRSYEALGQIYEEEQANLERAIKTGDERLIKQYQDRLHEVEMMRETSYESMLSSWTEALQAANDLFDTKLTNMITSLKQNLGDIDKLVEIYDRAVELEDLYVSGNKSIYELSKLARDVGKDIDKTANIIAKNKLTGLLEQINKLRAEGVKLSQYDLEYWQAKYELEVAEIALQEAQEAKAQVKLTRNTAGGWGYTYVADAEAISEAQQNYEDSLYNMQELHDEYIRDYSERLIKNRQDLVNALQDLDKTSLTFEEDALKLKEHHFKQEEYLIDELNKVYERAGVSYQDTLLAQTYGGVSLEDSHTNFINSVVKMIQDELLPGYQEFQESVDGINSQAGTTIEDAMDKIFESSMTMEDEVVKNINDLTSGVKEVSDEIWNFQETYGEAISKMLADNEEYYSKTIKMYQNFMDETEADKWLQYFDDMRGPGEVLGVAGSGATGAMAGNGSTAVTNRAFQGVMGSIAETYNGEGRSSLSKGKNSGDPIRVGEGAPEGMLLNSDGTNRGITVISPDEENISYAQIRAARDLKGSGNGNLSGYDTNGDGALSENELSKALKAEGINPKDAKYNKDSDKEKDPTLNGTFATGGYTGSWGSEGRWAMLHEKELVLNKYDTENMLDMVNTLRDIDWRAKLSELWTNIEEHFIAPIFGGGDNLQQDVRIEASFPGVSNHTEIEEAFNNLINTASQYANRRRY